MLTCQPARSRPLEHLNAPRWARRRDVLALQRMVQAEPRLLYRSLAVPVSTLHFPEGTGSGQRNVLAAALRNGKILLLPAQSGVGSRERVRPVSTIMAHSGEIEALASSGNILASASQDHFLKVWDLNRVTDVVHAELPVCTFRGHGSYLLSCAFDDQGALLLSSSLDSSLRVWHKGSPEAAFVFNTASPCTSASFIPGSQFMILAAMPDGASIFDLRMHRSYGHMQAVFSINHALQHGASAEDLSLPSWYMEQQRIDTIWESGHPAPRSGSAWASIETPRPSMPTTDKPLLTIKDTNTTSTLQYDLFTKTYTPSFAGHNPTCGVYFAGCTPDGKYILTASTDDTIKVWDMYSQKGLDTFTGADLSAQPRPELIGDMVACASAEGSVHMWDMCGSFRRHAFRSPGSTPALLEGNAAVVIGTEGGAGSAGMAYSAHTTTLAYANNSGNITLLSPELS